MEAAEEVTTETRSDAATHDALEQAALSWSLHDGQQGNAHRLNDWQTGLLPPDDAMSPLVQNRQESMSAGQTASAANPTMQEPGPSFSIAHHQYNAIDDMDAPQTRSTTMHALHCAARGKSVRMDSAGACEHACTTSESHKVADTGLSGSDEFQMLLAQEQVSCFLDCTSDAHGHRGTTCIHGRSSQL